MNSVMILLAVAAAVATLPPTEGPESALRRFLLTDCEVGEAEPALVSVMRHAEALRPALELIVRDGPAPELLEEITLAATRQWNRRAALLLARPTLPLPSDVERSLHDLSMEGYIHGARVDFDRVCREKAAAALAAIEALRSRAPSGSATSPTTSLSDPTRESTAERRGAPVSRPAHEN